MKSYNKKMTVKFQYFYLCKKITKIITKIINILNFLH